MDKTKEEIEELRTCYRLLLARLEMLESVIYHSRIDMNWISVDDRLPHLWEDVLVCAINNEDTIGFKKGEFYPAVDRLVKWNDTGDVSFRSEKFGMGKVTHWLPIPKLPEVK